MDFSLDSWMQEYRQAVERCFGERIWFLGLQGSYGRGEATAESDIDVVLILDRLQPEDLQAYSRLLDTLPRREKVCGFVSGRGELLAWDPSDLFQFYYDTTPVKGSLEELRKQIWQEDIGRAIHLGACNIYHGCAHNLVHEKSREILQGLYKSAVFTLQAVAFLRTGAYCKRREELRAQLLPEERKILEIGRRLKETSSLSEEELAADSAPLLEWAAEWVRKGPGGALPCP